MFKIFLVESEQDLNHHIMTSLEQAGWQVYSFYDGASALKFIHEYPHLWILDIMFFRPDSYLILSQIKETTPNIPVVSIFAIDKYFDSMLSLQLGFDDFLVKPFLSQELIIRCRRLLERFYTGVNTNISRINLHPYMLDDGKREVCLGQTKIELTAKEYDLLWYFAKQRGKALSREQIINHIWGNDYVGTERSVDDLVRRLRRKMLELNIETLYGYGYRMKLQ